MNSDAVRQAEMATTPGQLLFTFCLKGYGEDVGASASFDQIPIGPEQLRSCHALKRAIHTGVHLQPAEAG